MGKDDDIVETEVSILRELELREISFSFKQENGHVFSLDLSRKGLTSLPPEIGNLRYLRELDISCNQIARFPRIRWMILRELNLAENQLRELDVKEIKRMENLETLNLSKNQLTSLPKEIWCLVNLQYLNLSGNRLARLPYEIGRLSNQLWLDLTGNEELGVLAKEWDGISEEFNDFLLLTHSMDERIHFLLNRCIREEGRFISLDLKEKISPREVGKCLGISNNIAKEVHENLTSQVIERMIIAEVEKSFLEAFNNNVFLSLSQIDIEGNYLVDENLASRVFSYLIQSSEYAYGYKNRIEVKKKPKRPGRKD